MYPHQRVLENYLPSKSRGDKTQAIPSTSKSRGDTCLCGQSETMISEHRRQERNGEQCVLLQDSLEYETLLLLLLLCLRFFEL